MKEMTDKQKQSWLERAVGTIAGGLFGEAYKAKQKHKKRLQKVK